MKSGNLNFLEHFGPLQAYNGIAFYPLKSDPETFLSQKVNTVEPSYNDIG